ncbi:ATP-binding protein [Nonomuraea lactucae]|uniref:ATP-binding protein n=1 Tax=Nonomuraea lactucae TaxID=2249762 RepID=UPI000DE2AF3B|nr:LuxR family transcriptional regulator [Nonomuraea lactucae]
MNRNGHSNLATVDHPSEPSRFVGRRHELSVARRMLSRTRLLTLTGTGGVGKTRLALRLAENVRGLYKDGVEVVELATLEAGDLLGPTVAAALGLRDEATDSTTLLVDFLSDKRMLLILDNCEHLLDDCANLVDRMLRSAPRLRVLATSRQTLGVYGEQVLSVPSLSVPDPGDSTRDIARHDAVRLFVDRASSVWPGFVLDAGNAASVARLAQHLEGIPLAIELAAARLRSLPLEQVTRELDECMNVPDVGTSIALPRHRTLRATMDWSFRLCSPGEQRVWARLSIFPGGVGLDSAEVVCSGEGIDAHDVFDLLSGLVDKSIVVGERWEGGVRYRMLDSIRAYGADQLEADEARALRWRYIRHYRELMERNRIDMVVPDQIERYRVVQRELPNARAALEMCLDGPGMASVGLGIAAAMWGFWLLAGSFTEGRYWLERGLQQVPVLDSDRATALWVDAMLALRQGDPDAATPRVEECHVIARRVEDEHVLPYAVRVSGVLTYAHGDPDRGLELMEEALALHRAAGDLTGVVFALYYLAAYGSVQDPDKSAALGEELLALCEAHHAEVTRGYAQLSLGLAAWNQGDPHRADALVSEAAEFTEKVNDRWCLTQCLEVLAWTAGGRGDHRRAAWLLGAAHAMWQAADASPRRLQYHAVWHERCEDEARRALGERAFKAAFDDGARQRLAHTIMDAISA